MVHGRVVAVVPAAVRRECGRRHVAAAAAAAAAAVVVAVTAVAAVDGPFRLASRGIRSSVRYPPKTSSKSSDGPSCPRWWRDQGRRACWRRCWTGSSTKPSWERRRLTTLPGAVTPRPRYMRLYRFVVGEYTAGLPSTSIGFSLLLLVFRCSKATQQYTPIVSHCLLRFSAFYDPSKFTFQPPSTATSRAARALHGHHQPLARRTIVWSSRNRQDHACEGGRRRSWSHLFERQVHVTDYRLCSPIPFSSLLPLPFQRTSLPQLLASLLPPLPNRTTLAHVRTRPTASPR